MGTKRAVPSISLTDDLPPLGITVSIAFYDDERCRHETKHVYVPRPPVSIAEAISLVEAEAIAQTGESIGSFRKVLPRPERNYRIEKVEDAGPIPHILVRLVQKVL